MPAATAGRIVVNSTADLAKIGDAPITILVLDELNMDRQDAIYARDKLIQWLTRQPAVLPEPTALSAVTYTDFTLLRDFTQDRDALLAILKKHSTGVLWRSENAGRVGEQASANMAASMGALERISQAMRGVPGRKNLIWVGDGFPGVNIGDTGRTEADEISANLRRLSNVMLHARVTLSVVGPTLKGFQPTVIETQADSDMASSANYDGFLLAKSGLMTFGGLAPPTGGHAYAGRNDLDAEIGRSIVEGESYYTVSYRPSEPNDNPREYRDIHVDVTRPGVTVQTRSGYFGEPKDPPSLTRADTQQLAFDLNGAATSA
jgi:VWFA-related protein